MWNIYWRYKLVRFKTCFKLFLISSTFIDVVGFLAMIMISTSGWICDSNCLQTFAYISFNLLRITAFPSFFPTEIPTRKWCWSFLVHNKWQAVYWRMIHPVWKFVGTPHFFWHGIFSSKGSSNLSRCSNKLIRLLRWSKFLFYIRIIC